MKKSYLIIAILFIISGWYFFRVRKQEDTAEKLIIGTSADYPPFEYIENGTIVGMEIDLVKEIASRINREIEIKDLPFDMLLQELQMGNIHIVAAALTETPQRAERILFTPPYMEGDSLLLVSLKNDPVENIDELVGGPDTVVVNEGYTSDIYASQFKGLNIVRLKTPAEAFLALNNKKVKAYIIAEDVASEFFKKNPKDQYSVKKLQSTSDTYALGISKKHRELLVPIAAALNNIMKDGTIESLKEKWQLYDR